MPVQIPCLIHNDVRDFPERHQRIPVPESEKNPLIIAPDREGIEPQSRMERTFLRGYPALSMVFMTVLWMS